METPPRQSRKERTMMKNPKRSLIQVLKFSRKEKQEERKKEKYLQEVQAMRQLAVRERKSVSIKYRLPTADWIQNAD